MKKRAIPLDAGGQLPLTFVNLTESPAMYAKLFARITESSIMESTIETRYVFLMLLAVADPKGYVIGTDVALARRLNMPLESFQDAVARLRQPDPNSNSQEEEGRRIIPSDGERGYFLVNYRKYSELKNEDGRREYMREYMRLKRAEDKGEIQPGERKQRLAALTHADESEDGEPEADGNGKKPPYSPDFEHFWKAYPRKVGKGGAWKKWRALKPHLPTVLKAIETQRQSDQWRKDGGQFIPHPETWLNKGRWEDEISAPITKPAPTAF